MLLGASLAADTRNTTTAIATVTATATTTATMMQRQSLDHHPLDTQSLSDSSIGLSTFYDLEYK